LETEPRTDGRKKSADAFKTQQLFLKNNLVFMQVHQFQSSRKQQYTTYKSQFTEQKFQSGRLRHLCSKA